jgi:hypothetical protein
MHGGGEVRVCGPRSTVADDEVAIGEGVRISHDHNAVANRNSVTVKTASAVPMFVTFTMALASTEVPDAGLE